MMGFNLCFSLVRMLSTVLEDGQQLIEVGQRLSFIADKTTFYIA
jgi:hypothetical protein